MTEKLKTDFQGELIRSNLRQAPQIASLAKSSRVRSKIYLLGGIFNDKDIR